jgi:hypothetical protein
VRDLIERAEKDSSVYPPVALRLADWTPKRGSIRDWVTSSLATDRIPIDVAQDWLARSDFVVLLDALDEVRANHRAECVAAINAFLAESPLTLVVSCRETDYEHLSTKLPLETAVFLRPLTRRAVDTAVSAAGPSLTNLKVALKWAPDLYNVLDSPLMLDIARISYASAGDLQLASSAPATPSDLRQRLFAVYVQRMIGSVSKTRASSKRMERTLTWIADNLRRREQTNFVKSSLVQLLWLPRSGDLASRAVREVGCVVGALIGLVLGSFLGALGAFLGRKVGVHFGSIAAIGGSIAAGGLAGTLGGEVCSIMARSAVEYEHIDQLWKDWKEGTFPLIKLFERLLAWVNRAWYFQALITIEHLAGAALYLFGLLLLALSVRTFPAGALIGLVLGACISAAANNGKRLRSFLAKESEQQRIPSLARKGSEHKAQSATTAGVDQLEKPAFPDSAAAQAVDSSAMKRLLRILNYLGLFFIIAAFLIAVPFILLLLQVDKIVAWLTERTQRYVIAWLLWREGVAPLDHGKFLDAATSRALLRLEVGSEVYRFIHPLLGAYFASCAVAKNRAAHL